MSETLSLVITDCWSPVMGNSRMSTLSIWSTKGRRMRRPGWSTDRNSPKRLTTPTLPCWTILSAARQQPGADPHDHHHDDNRRDRDDLRRRCQHGRS